MHVTRTTQPKAQQAQRPPRGEAIAGQAGQDAREAEKAARLAALRERVFQLCDTELRKLARGAGQDPAFARGLRSIAAEMAHDREALATVQRGYQVLEDILRARDTARDMLKAKVGDNRQPWTALRGLVSLLDGRPELRFHYPEGEATFTHREVVLRRFDSEDFLGLRRPATVRELALLCLWLDAVHGVHEGRIGKPTPWPIVKAEEDAIRLARKRLR
jgi:hypothetical protein